MTMLCDHDDYKNDDIDHMHESYAAAGAVPAAGAAPLLLLVLILNTPPLLRFLLLPRPLLLRVFVSSCAHSCSPFASSFAPSNSYGACERSRFNAF